MTTIQVFDPPMCCSTEVCGPGVDPALARFAGDLEWLRSRGLRVERFNLAQQPGAFTANPAVREALAEGGTPLSCSTRRPRGTRCCCSTRPRPTTGRCRGR